MTSIILKVYEILPQSIKIFLSTNRAVSSLRRKVLRNHGNPRQITVSVTWNNSISFKFHAPLKIAEKAKNRGIENTILRNSISMFSSNSNDCNVIDVGANYGFLSMVWAKSICSRGGKVFSFEPHPRIAAALKETIRINGLHKTVQPHTVAMGNQVDMVDLYLYGLTSNTKLRRIEPLEMAKIQQITLDTFCRKQAITRCDLIKIDTDGSELDVLMGGHAMLERFRPIIIVETNGRKEMLNYLRKIRYQLMDINLKDLSNDTIPPNIFAIPIK